MSVSNKPTSPLLSKCPVHITYITIRTIKITKCAMWRTCLRKFITMRTDEVTAAAAVMDAVDEVEVTVVS